MSSDVSQISKAWVDHHVKSTDSGFQYDALSQETSFRLLKLLPASDTSSPIICTMSEERIDDSSLKYAALSYTWGSTQDKKEIILNSRPALITQNLHMALQHIRHMTGLLGNILQPLPLWIDALSINQQDETEKAMQIGHMYQIFANAQPVVAWLGLEGDGSDMIMDAIKQGNSVDVASIPAPALLSFLNRPWWTRAWVLQECMAAGSLMWLVCGSSYTSFITVFPFVNKVLMYIDRQSYYIQRTALREVLSSRWHFFIHLEKYEKEQVFPLYDIIKLSSKLEATDSRDKVFALLGLVDDQTTSQIRPDYTLSPCEIFCKAIRVMAQDKERSAIVLEKLKDFDSIGSRGHRPLVENVYERQKCDGVACSSKSLCFNLPTWASGSVSDLVDYFIMGLQNPGTV
ncbi:hypothetical protein FGG08_002917 [Glutinoglossum americanum]|uniref:Heterokaryon incompatibility domain-containing protein n=1 Tax=Glutinoglossum americanum TaxID=1670608 RepID=A0A9P8IAP7_9PEZI|nr:hypothetical protein FGG08_002917 [Glutinoglossum americanum]